MDVFRLVLLLVVLQGDIEKMRTASSSWPGLFLAKHAPGVADVPAMIDEPQPFHPIDQVSIRDSKGFTFEALDTDHVTRVQVLWINIAGDPANRAQPAEYSGMPEQQPRVYYREQSMASEY